MTSNRRFETEQPTEQQSPKNRIITRGLGPLMGGIPQQAGLVTQGYTATYTLAAAGDLILRLAQYERGKSGGKSRKRKMLPDDIIISARLIGVNDDAIKSSIAGSTTTPILRSLARLTVEHVKKQISITIKRILS